MKKVDFVVLKNKKPMFAVECKKSDKACSPNLFYFRDRLNIPMFYQVSLSGEEKSIDDRIVLTSLENLCRRENLL
jgi:hypothetical protein